MTFKERVEIMDQTSVELAQSSVKDWSFVAVTRSVTVAVTRSVSP